MYMETVPTWHYHRPRSTPIEPSAIGGIVIVGIIAALVLVLALMTGCFAFKFLQGRTGTGSLSADHDLEPLHHHHQLDRKPNYPPSLLRFLNRHQKSSSDSLPLLDRTSKTRDDLEISAFQEQHQVNDDHLHLATCATDINLPELSDSTTTTPSTTPSPPAIPEVPDRAYPAMPSDDHSTTKTHRFRLLPPIPSPSPSQLNFRLSNHLPSLTIPSSPIYDSPVASTVKLTPGSPTDDFRFFSPAESRSSQLSSAFPPVPPLPDHLKPLERLNTVAISHLLKSRAKRVHKLSSRTSTQSSRLERFGSISSVLSSIDERPSGNDVPFRAPTRSSGLGRIGSTTGTLANDENPSDGDSSDKEVKSSQITSTKTSEMVDSSKSTTAEAKQPSGPRPRSRPRSKRPFVPPPPFIPPPNPQPRKPFPNTMGSVQASSQPPCPLRAVVSLASQHNPSPQSSWPDPPITYPTTATITHSDDPYLPATTAPLRIKRHKTGPIPTVTRQSTLSAPTRPVAGPRARTGRHQKLSPVVSESHLEYEDSP